MDCNEAAEFVSALYDGETIPREAAEHLGRCAACQAQLQTYMEIGVELRRVASIEVSGAVQPRLWSKSKINVQLWWQKGWETMKIPRLAFAVMSAGIVVLASSLAVVGVRAHDDGTVVMLKVIDEPGDKPTPCVLSTVDKNHDFCGAVVGIKDGMLTYKWKFLQKDGNRVQLGFRSKLDHKGTGSYVFSVFDNLPEKQYWFEPGKTLEVDLPNNGKMFVTGEWMDHIPAFEGWDEASDPGPGQLRIRSPLLLKGKTVAGDFEGGSVVIDETEKGIGAELVVPGAGRFRFSLSPLKGAIKGHVNLNRITFESDGQTYVLITSTPITRGETVWVLHDADYKVSGKYPDNISIGNTDVSDLMINSPATK